ncbi:MAG: hypothetical protein U5K27_09305 [Desulfotignum sp.]|nr:hypothetical protein [Desulfotignum sp.]
MPDLLVRLYDLPCAQPIKGFTPGIYRDRLTIKDMEKGDTP